MPKDPAIRQRTNRTPGAAKLDAAANLTRRAPPLPKVNMPDGSEREWEKLTRAFWRDCWRSPMATEYLQADIHGLYRLAVLVDDFWKEPTKELAGEIRLQQQQFGLSPLDRRRLQWEVEKVEAVTRRQQPPPSLPQSSEDDPRRLLSVVS
jgi:hypothetical protein